MNFALIHSTFGTLKIVMINKNLLVTAVQLIMNQLLRNVSVKMIAVN